MDQDGDTVVRFATRNTHDTAEAHIDDDYSIYRDANGTLSYYARIMPYKDLGFSFFIAEAPNENGTVSQHLRLSVVTGSYEVPVREDGSGQYQDALIDVVRRTLRTARIVHQRREADSEQADIADANAKQLLEARVISEQPASVIHKYDSLLALAA